ncbi:PH domain-containing protein [Actinoplanes sp. NPDC026670]|uniref:PH domain-containing protein n=1 Tax=Actinoplanes sp. NPDC026670 TaxID=3154700 RepID=UPI0033FA35E4
MGEYRVSRSMFVRGTVVIGGGTVALVLMFATIESMPALARAAITLVIVAAGGLAFWSTLSRTSFDDDGVHVRMLWTRRSFPWPQIQDVRVDSQRAAAAMSNLAPAERAVLVDRSGHMVNLPYLESLNVELRGSSFALEFDRVHAAWVQRRGADWAPDPAAAARFGYRLRHGNPWLRSAYWAIGALVAGIFLEDLPFPFGPGSIVWFPLLTYAAVAGLLLSRRRRALRTV